MLQQLEEPKIFSFSSLDNKMENITSEMYL